MTIRLKLLTAKWAPPPPSIPEDIPVETIDADDNPEELLRLGAKGLPMLVAYRDGQVVGGLLGAASADTVDEWLKGLEL